VNYNLLLQLNTHVGNYGDYSVPDWFDAGGTGMPVSESLKASTKQERITSIIMQRVRLAGC
jgi:hypothetical protein